MSVQVIHGDARLAVELLDDASIDSVVTDPPYALVSIAKRFSADNAAPAKGGVYARAAAGFMGKKWDTGEVAFDPAFWVEVLRVLKPGGHVVAFGGTRTYHRLACAIEDAGFEIRDQIGWLYGSGFPKSHDAGDGWGTALKPAWEPIVLARKPLIGTVAANVLAHGTGAINIDECRVGDEERYAAFTSLAPCHGNALGAAARSSCARGTQGEPKRYVGRWPANIVHDGSDEVIGAFPTAPGQIADASSSSDRRKNQNVYGAMKRGNGREGEASADRVYADKGGTNFAMRPGARRGDSGSAARFFYSAKASKADRNGSKHPTVKPISLKRYLCRLITPKGGTVLDPFAGSGTTGAAALAEGFKAILIEREAEYVADIRRRLEPQQEDLFA